MTYFLAGDIGGTKTLLQIFASGSERVPLLQKSYPSASYAGLSGILDEFTHEAGIAALSSACFAIAGPVAGRKVKLTNLPWEVDADALESHLGGAQVSVINDFEAVGLGVAALSNADLLFLQQGEAVPQGIRLVVGAGTGLGVAWLSSQNGCYVVHPSEGGHMDFAPADDEQYALLHYLQQRYGHVSYERIVSGPGLVAIYEFLRDSALYVPSAAFVDALRNGDQAAIISSSVKSEAIAGHALRLFVSIYGAFTGNLALAALPRGGIYVAGGIAAKISAHMQAGEFMHAFCAKGRFDGLLSTLPVAIVNNPHVGLLGASLRAQKLA